MTTQSGREQRPDPTQERITAAIERSRTGDRATARDEFATIWAELGPDADPFHLCTLAHFAADVQDDPHQELAWDLRALAAAHRLDDERAQRYDPVFTVAGFLPSLHLSLAEDYRKLGDRDTARQHLGRVREHLPALRDDGYGATIRAVFDRVAAQVETEGSTSG